MPYREISGRPTLFYWRLRVAKRKLRSRGQFVALYTPNQYRDMRLFVADDGLSGFAVKPDGDIVSVWSLAKGRLAEMLDVAREAGGYRLDCFQPLAKVYQRHGFRVTGRVRWDDQYAPEGWDYGQNGRPDVIYLALDVARQSQEVAA